MEGSYPFQTGHVVQIGHADHSAITTVRVPSGIGSLELPSGCDFLRADFAREGFDLILDAGSFGTVVVPDYFLRLSPPDLVTEDGAVLPHHIVRTLAGPMAPGQVAQLGIGSAAAATDTAVGAPIGSVSESQGAVTVLHPDGTEAMLVTGDPIFQGDVLVTGPDGSVSVIFVDDTVFSLDVDGRMVMDEMVYDASSQTGTFNAMVVQGVFSFVSGQVAKTSPDGMVVNTPTATIGIRGSTVVGNAAAEGTANKITLVRDVDGNVGEIIISNGVEKLVLSQAGASTTVASANAALGPIQVLSQQEIQQSYGGSLTRLVKTVARQAEQKAEQAQEKAQQSEAEAEAAKAEADAAKAEAEAAKAEADAAQAEAEAAIAEAEAAGDEQAVAEAKAKAAAAAEAAAQAEAAAAAAEQQAAAAEAEAQQAAVEAEQADAFNSMASTALAVQVAAEAAVQKEPATQEAEKTDTAQKADTVTPDGGQNKNGQGGENTTSPDPGPDLLPLPGTDELPEGVPELDPLLGLDLPKQSVGALEEDKPEKPIPNDEPTPNSTPIAVGEILADVTEDSGVITGKVVGVDADGDALVYELDEVSVGTLTMSSDGAYTFVLPDNYYGVATFTYTVSDGQSISEEATVSVTVTAVNDLPVLNDVSFNANEDQVISGALAATDVDGDTLTYALGPANARALAVSNVQLNSDGTFTYTPTANFVGTDSFTVTASDGNGGTATATVTVSFSALNDAPIFTDVSVNATEDQSASGTFAATDVEGDALTYGLGAQGVNGTATVNTDGTYTYVPNANFTGTDSFTATVSDGQGGTATSTVTVNVAPVNDVPVFADVNITTTEDQNLSGSFAATDVEGDALTYGLGAQGVNGTAAVNADGTYTYTPKTNFAGTDTFTVTVSDGNGGAATNTVTVNVTPVNDAPVFADVSIAATEDQSVTGTFGATDVDGDTLTYGLGTQGANGTATVNADGTYSYVPSANFAGTDTFTATVSDGNGGSTTSTVTVNVAAVNDDPVVNMTKLESGPLGFTTGGGTTFDALVTNSFQAGASALSDLDNDGDLDIVMLGYDSVAGSATSSTYVGLNDGSGNFTYSTAITNNLYMNRMAVDDVNGDGIADIVFAENSATAQPIYFGDGAGGFTQSNQVISTTGGITGTKNVALADFNGDGLNDMFVNIDAGIKVFLNAQNGDAAGTFTDSGQSLTTPKTTQSYRGLALGDVNGDGHIDAVTGTWGENMDIWINDGTGTFSNTNVIGTGRLNTSAGASNGVDLGDLDGDGDLDLFVFNRYISNQVFLNDGTGNFTQTQSVGTTGAREDGKLVDIDGDGDLDAIMAADAGMEIFVNDGSANFTVSNFNIGNSWPTQVHGGDLNGDGAVDILVANPGTGSDILTNTRVTANAEVLRSGSLIFQDTTFGVTDADNPATSTLTFTVLSVPTNGSLQLSGVALSANQTFTQADVVNGLVSYTNSGTASALDTFTFSVSDGQGGFSLPHTFNVSVLNTPINGTAGIDNLSGTAGIDTITGGASADILTGGAGSDRFVYKSATDAPLAGNETITDFDATDAAEDIVLQGLLTGTFSYLGSGAFTSSGNTELIFNDTSKLLSIDANGNGATDLEITLTGVAIADLDATDFTVS